MGSGAAGQVLTKAIVVKMRQEDFQWTLEPHCCRICLGRVAMRKTFEGRRIYRCTCCGVEAEGVGPQAICACGIKLRQHHGKMDSGIRCVANASRTPENMSEFVAVQIDAPKAEASAPA